MKALKLSSEPDEKKQLKAQCSEFMDIADRIKNAKDWAALIRQLPEGTKSEPPKRTKHEQIGKWAAEVAGSTNPTNKFEDTASQSSYSLHGLSSKVTPVNTDTTSGTSLGSRDVSLAIRSTGVSKSAHNQPTGLSENRLPPPYDSTSMSPAGGRRGDNLQTEHQRETSTVASSEMAPKPSSRRPTPATAISSGPHVHRLREPISTRKRSTKEEIILLKASRVNGLKCPPWNPNTTSAEFERQQGEALFT
jgi:calpain-7